MAPRRRMPSVKGITSGIANRTLARRFSTTVATGDFIPHTYSPTKTTWPSNGWKHPCTSSAGYDSRNQTLEITFFTNGATYRYQEVTPAIARQFYLTESPGTFIRTVLNRYPYERIN